MLLRPSPILKTIQKMGERSQKTLQQQTANKKLSYVQCNISSGTAISVFMASSVCFIIIYVHGKQMRSCRNGQLPINTLFMEKPPNGKLSELSVHSFALLTESAVEEE